MFSHSRFASLLSVLGLSLALPVLADSPPGMTHHVRPMGSHVQANKHLRQPTHHRRQGLAPRASWPFWRQPPRHHYGPGIHHQRRHRHHPAPHHGAGIHHPPRHHVSPPHHVRKPHHRGHHGRFVQKGRILYLYGDHDRVLQRLALGHREKWIRRHGRVIVYGGNRIRVYDRHLGHKGNLFIGSGAKFAFNHDHIVVRYRRHADIYDYNLRHLKRHHGRSGLHLSFH